MGEGNCLGTALGDLGVEWLLVRCHIFPENHQEETPGMLKAWTEGLGCHPALYL